MCASKITVEKFQTVYSWLNRCVRESEEGIACTRTLFERFIWKSAWSGVRRLYYHFENGIVNCIFGDINTRTRISWNALCAFVYFKFFPVYPFVYLDFSIWKCLKWVFSSPHLSAAAPHTRGVWCVRVPMGSKWFRLKRAIVYFSA